MSDDERTTLLAEMRKDRAGQRALDALLEAFACRQVMRQAINSETRIVASMDMLDWSLAAMQEIGAFEEIKRQMVSHVNGRQVNTGTDSNTHKLLRPKHRRTEAGQRQIRAATERLLLIMEPYVIGSHAANATVGHLVAADAGYDGPFGSGDEAGGTLKTTKSQGVDPSKGADFCFRLLAMPHAGYHFGSQGIEIPADQIPLVKWTPVAAWIRRRGKLFRNRTWNALTLRRWATETTQADNDRDVSPAKAFEQGRKEGLADFKAGCIDRRNKGCDD